MWYIYFREANSDWHKFICSLDMELFIGGLGKNINNWAAHDFSGDPYWRLYLPLKGEFNLHYSTQIFQVKPGYIYLIPALRPFEFQSVSFSTHYFLHFFSEKLMQISYLLNPQAIKIKDFKYTRMLFSKILKQMKSDDGIWRSELIRQSLMELLIPFLQTNKDEIIISEKCNSFSKVLDYIDSNLDRDIKIKELIKFTQYSRSEFSAEFRKQFGIPPKQYISSRRISKAKVLLLKTSLNNKEIATQCGYEDAFFFYRIFRKYTTMSPGKYRNRNHFE